jgi:hypothetical protein
MTVSALRHSDTARSRFRVAIASRGLSSVRSVSSFADTWNSLRRPVPRHKQDDTSAAASTGRRQFSSHGPTRDGTPRALVNGETVAGARSSWAEIGWTEAEPFFARMSCKKELPPSPHAAKILRCAPVVIKLMKTRSALRGTSLDGSMRSELS